MDLSTSTSLGAHLMKGYLEYAEHGVDMLGRTIAETAGEFDSPFEEEVAAALVRIGIEPVSQVGCGGFRIDLAIRKPQYPGQYCLGIECDGATYHSSHTARDRDRIRQSILEDLGWKIVRIWSTDWVRDSDRQVRRILDAYELASLAVNDANEVLILNGNAETNSEDLEPQYVEAPEEQVRTYQKIEDVPFQEIANVALSVLGRVGAIDWNELIVYMARDLGFARTGKKIRETFERVLLVQLHKGEIHRAGERVYIP